jgi:UDP-N-acetylmuramoyl-tripeptide--D-alanyl-D-alanine ligase
MSGWTLDDLAAITAGRWVVAPTADPFSFVGVAIDTRELEHGQFFFAFVGEHVDGHNFLLQAANAGASACVVSDRSKLPDDLAIPVLLVDDVLGALTTLASAWRERLDATVIAITGSNGKTTTCRLIHSICTQVGASHSSIKSFNNALGVPITILNTPIDAQYLVCELGTSSPGEIAARAALAKPDIAVITSIGRAHLEELGDRSGVAKEKAEIVSALAKGAPAIIPGGVEELKTALSPIASDRTIIRVGTDHPISITKTTSTHTDFTIDGEAYTIPMLGMHNASNAAMSVMVGRALGIDEQMIRAGLASPKLPEMRFDRIEIPTKTAPIVLYNDAYNANPDSMRAALVTFDALETGSPKVAILGEMLELGVRSAEEHRAIVGEFDGYRSIERFILVGKSWAAIEPTAGDERVTVYETPDDFNMTLIARSIKPGSMVLLKGSRMVKLERIVYILMSHDAANPISRATRAST